jgi:hypothetical protein
MILETLATLGALAGGAAATRYLWRKASGSATEAERLHAQVLIEQARHQHALPPQSYSSHLHYAPHQRVDSAASSPSVEVRPGDTVQAPEPALPGALDLLALNHTPDKHNILLGVAPGGQQITVSANRLVHVAVAGATGSGKTNTSRLLLAQLLASGVRCLVANPHHTDYDAASGEDWQPITSRLHLAPARNERDIGALLHWLAVEEITKRLERREAKQRPGAPIVLFLDELPVIAADVEGAVPHLTKLLRQGRALGLFVAGASQDFLVKTLGGGSGVRDCYRTAAYSGGDVVSAASLLDMSRKDIAAVEGELGGGVALLRSHATTPARLVRVPYVSNEALYRLLPDNLHQQAPSMPRVNPAAHQQRDGIQHDAVCASPPAGDRPDVCQFDAEQAAAASAPARGKPVSVEAERALALLMAGKSTTEITEELRGVNSRQGGKYRAAANEIHELLREALAAHGVAPDTLEREASA